MAFQGIRRRRLKEILRIGTRSSRLALCQAREVKRRLEKLFPKIRFMLVTVKTRGDEFQSVELFKKNHTGVFTKAIEKKLLNAEIDIAVHSLKDLPTEPCPGLRVGAFPKRLDARDVLISRGRCRLSDLPPGASVGTGSPRRKRQLSALRPDLKVRDLRGNLDTRVRKVLKEKKLDAIVVARAGLLRLKKYLRYARTLGSDRMLSAPGQGGLAVQTRKKDRRTLRIVAALNHPRTQREVTAERILLERLGGGCRVPIGVYSKILHGKIRLKASVFSVRTAAFRTAEISAAETQYRQVAARLARILLKKGAGRFLKEARA